MGQDPSTLLLYCERALSAAPQSLLAEPVNVLSNLGYCAVGLWAMGLPQASRDVRLLGWLAVLVGVGSALFHALATRWALVADVVPIAAFVMAAWIAATREVTPQLRLFLSVVVVVIALVGAWLGRGSCQPLRPAFAALRDLPVYCLNGGFSYLAAVFAIGSVGAITWSSARRAAVLYFAAGALLATSLAVRALDPHACPLGEGPGIWGLNFGASLHAMWHLGTAATMALIIVALRTQRGQRRNLAPM